MAEGTVARPHRGLRFGRAIEMRILLQQRRRRLCLRSMGVWTVYAELAVDFEHSQRAIDFALQYVLTGVQLSVQFVDAEIEGVRLPELEEGC